MLNSREIKRSSINLHMQHDFQRQLMEIPSLVRVINNYYNKKAKIQEQIRPKILKQFKESLKAVENSVNWLFSIPTALSTLSDNILSKKDSFRFPDGIILFEAWMNLGYDALFPKFALQFKFPGILKGEITRNVIQFIFSTSRGFGFPIYFNPQFVGYLPKFLKYLDLFLEWTHSVCHKINQAIILIESRFDFKRHHPGEFESIIISKYRGNIYKGTDTLFHGYFTNDPKKLGKFNSLKELFEKVTFSYTIGDHAMSVINTKSKWTQPIHLITYEDLKNHYDVDFYSYISNLIKVDKYLKRKIIEYRKLTRMFLKSMGKLDKLKIISSRRRIGTYSEKNKTNMSRFIAKYSIYRKLLEELRVLLWTTPLYTHTIHKPTKSEMSLINSKKFEIGQQDSTNSILLSFINYFQDKYKFIFEEREVIQNLELLRDDMAKMWLYFKERHFQFAKHTLNEISSITLSNKNYKEVISSYINTLVPIISIYEIFHRSLSESAYPEVIPRVKRIKAYLAKFLVSKYSIIGFNLVRLFNKLAFNKWSFLIRNRKYDRVGFFNLILNLPIWNSIPADVKEIILKNNENLV